MSSQGGCCGGGGRERSDKEQHGNVSTQPHNVENKSGNTDPLPKGNAATVPANTKPQSSGARHGSCCGR